jgi:hypothetical protein
MIPAKTAKIDNTTMQNAFEKLTRYAKQKARNRRNQKAGQHGCKAFEALGLPRDWY